MRVSSTKRKSFYNIFVFLIIVSSIVGIAYAKTGFFTDILNLFTKKAAASSKEIKSFLTSDNLLKPNPVVVASNASQSEEVIINDDGTLGVQSGSMRISTEKEKVTDGTISLYEVKPGDTLDTVAKLFGVSKNTIIWANDLKSQSVKPGDTLLIFPMNGMEYTVKAGGSIQDVAKKYNADASEIAEYNGIALDTKLAKGDTLFIPNAEVEAVVEPKKTTTKTVTKKANNIIAGYFMMPVSGCIKTQGLHGPYMSAVDIGCKVGTTVSAAAAGTVIRASSSGWNGGYGEVVIISHPNNTQTIYAHLSKVGVSVGQKVDQGQVIGATGNTGESTGPHLHFETRGTGNPF